MMLCVPRSGTYEYVLLIVRACAARIFCCTTSQLYQVPPTNIIFLFDPTIDFFLCKALDNSDNGICSEG